MRKGGETAKTGGLVAYRKLVKATQATFAQVQQVLPALREQTAPEAERLTETLETFLPRVEQVVSQTVRRVFQGEKLPAREKLVSIFEAHSDIIRRNKARKPTEYGHKVWLDEVDGGLVTRWQVLEGNPNDEQQWLPSLEHHIECFSQPPNQMSADRGVHSPENEQVAQEKGVKWVVQPQSGRKSEARKRYEKQRCFVRGRKWHAGVEGRISVLKRRNELDRCRDQGKTGFEKWVGWGVIAGNLLVIGRAVAARA